MDYHVDAQPVTVNVEAGKPEVTITVEAGPPPPPPSNMEMLRQGWAGFRYGWSLGKAIEWAANNLFTRRMSNCDATAQP